VRFCSLNLHFVKKLAVLTTLRVKITDGINIIQGERRNQEYVFWWESDLYSLA